RSGVIHVAFTPDGDQLLSEGWEGMLRLWDWRAGRQTLQRSGGSDLQFSRNGRLLVHDFNRLSLVEFATGREYRSFVLQSAVKKDVQLHEPLVHPEGKIFAVNASDGVRLFDVKSGDELGAIPEANYRIAFQADGALMTNGDRGLLRWPIRETEPGRWQAGPPQLLYGPEGFIDMASDRNGNLIAQATGSGALLVRPGKRPGFVGPHGGAQHVAVSPDGKYVATGVNNGENCVKIWDTTTHRLTAKFPVGPHCGAMFSPDGQWITVGGMLVFQVLRVGTWEPAFSAGFAQDASFSADGQLLATHSRHDPLRLLESATGRELARLEDPNQSAGRPVFTPDGTKLLISDD